MRLGLIFTNWLSGLLILEVLEVLLIQNRL